MLLTWPVTGADEEGTHERLKAHLGELVDPKIAEHRGRTVKNTGDGLLAEFPSVVDAVRCAVEVQRGMVDREPELPEERRISFRIGINLGDGRSNCVLIAIAGYKYTPLLGVARSTAYPSGIVIGTSAPLLALRQR